MGNAELRKQERHEPKMWGYVRFTQTRIQRATHGVRAAATAAAKMTHD
jgi:hypothetical protein